MNENSRNFMAELRSTTLNREPAIPEEVYDEMNEPSGTAFKSSLSRQEMEGTDITMSETPPEDKLTSTEVSSEEWPSSPPYNIPQKRTYVNTAGKARNQAGSSTSDLSSTCDTETDERPEKRRCDELNANEKVSLKKYRNKHIEGHEASHGNKRREGLQELIHQLDEEAKLLHKVSANTQSRLSKGETPNLQVLSSDLTLPSLPSDHTTVHSYFHSDKRINENPDSEETLMATSESATLTLESKDSRPRKSLPTPVMIRIIDFTLGTKRSIQPFYKQGMLRNGIHADPHVDRDVVSAENINLAVLRLNKFFHKYGSAKFYGTHRFVFEEPDPCK